MSPPDNNTNITSSYTYSKVEIGDGDGPVPDVNLSGDGAIFKAGSIIGRSVTVVQKHVGPTIKVDTSNPNWLEELAKSVNK